MLERKRRLSDDGEKYKATEKWYCDYCDALTPIEWSMDLIGAPTQCAQCAYCKCDYPDLGYGSCTNCGYYSEEDSVIEYGKSVSFRDAEYSWKEWKETHHCPKCGSVFSFWNSEC